MCAIRSSICCRGCLHDDCRDFIAAEVVVVRAVLKAAFRSEPSALYSFPALAIHVDEERLGFLRHCPAAPDNPPAYSVHAALTLDGGENHRMPPLLRVVSTTRRKFAWNCGMFGCFMSLCRTRRKVVALLHQAPDFVKTPCPSELATFRPIRRLLDTAMSSLKNRGKVCPQLLHVSAD